ncbi:hypothetical protein HK101_008536 [Irineochytrium annulatum]|nr:hypothetical protein HK101_008536 [Irineochytrium annulatum]
MEDEDNEDFYDDDVEEENWLVPSVREKAARRREKELERSVSANGGLESWDDDFEYGNVEEAAGKKGDRSSPGGGSLDTMGEGCDSSRDLGALRIPMAIGEVQESLRSDAVNMKKFALHIEDLKLIYLDAKDMAAGVAQSNRTALENIWKDFAAELDQAQVLIDLGEFAEEKGDSMVADERHLRVLAEILATPSSTCEASGKLRDREGSEATVCGLRELAASSGKLEFGISLLPALLRKIGPLKHRLNDFVGELRSLILA